MSAHGDPSHGKKRHDLDANVFTEVQDADNPHHYEHVHHHAPDYLAEDEHGHPDQDKRDKFYLNRDNILFMEPLGYEYFNDDHKDKMEKVGLKKWDEYTKNVRDFFARYNTSLEDLQKQFDEAKGKEKPTLKIELDIARLLEEATERGWDRFVITTGKGRTEKIYRLYEYGISGKKSLESLKKNELAGNAAAIETINKLIKLKTEALTNALKGAVGDIVTTYGWREATPEEKNQIEPYKETLSKEKLKKLEAEVEEAAHENGIIKKHIEQVLSEENLVADLQARGVTDEQIKKSALTRLKRLAHENRNFITSAYHGALRLFGRAKRENIVATGAEDRGISLVEESIIRSLVNLFLKDPRSDEVTEKIREGAKAGREPEKWLVYGAFFDEKKKTLIPDDKLAPRPSAYKKLINEWSDETSFDAFLKTLPKDVPPPTPKKEEHDHEEEEEEEEEEDHTNSHDDHKVTAPAGGSHNKHEAGGHAKPKESGLNATQRQFVQELVTFFSVGQLDQLIAKALKTKTTLIGEIRTNPNSTKAEEAKTIFDNYAHSDYAKFIEALPTAEQLDLVEKARTFAKDGHHHDEDNLVVDMLIDFIAGGKNESDKNSLYQHINNPNIKGKLEHKLYNLVNDQTKPAAPKEPEPVRVIRPTPKPKAPILRLVPDPRVASHAADILRTVSRPAEAPRTYGSSTDAMEDILSRVGVTIPPEAPRPTPPPVDTGRPATTPPDAASSTSSPLLGREPTVAAPPVSPKDEIMGIPGVPPAAGETIPPTAKIESFTTSPTQPANETIPAADTSKAPSPAEKIAISTEATDLTIEEMEEKSKRAWENFTSMLSKTPEGDRVIFNSGILYYRNLRISEPEISAATAATKTTEQMRFNHTNKSMYGRLASKQDLLKHRGVVEQLLQDDPLFKGVDFEMLLLWAFSEEDAVLGPQIKDARTSLLAVDKFRNDLEKIFDREKVINHVVYGGLERYRTEIRYGKNPEAALDRVRALAEKNVNRPTKSELDAAKEAYERILKEDPLLRGLTFEELRNLAKDDVTEPVKTDEQVKEVGPTPQRDDEDGDVIGVEPETEDEDGADEDETRSALSQDLTPAVETGEPEQPAHEKGGEPATTRERKGLTRAEITRIKTAVAEALVTAGLVLTDRMEEKDKQKVFKKAEFAKVVAESGMSLEEFLKWLPTERAYYGKKVEHEINDLVRLLPPEAKNDPELRALLSLRRYISGEKRIVKQDGKRALAHLKETYKQATEKIETLRNKYLKEKKLSETQKRTVDTFLKDQNIEGNLSESDYTLAHEALAIADQNNSNDMDCVALMLKAIASQEDDDWEIFHDTIKDPDVKKELSKDLLELFEKEGV